MSFNYKFSNLNPEDPGYAEQYDPSKSLIQPDQTITPKEGRVGSKRRTTGDLVQNLYKKNIPEPTFDQDKADRLQRMGRINQLGRSINVLGDIFGTAIGANTRRRQPDTTAPALYQSYQANLDKYKAEKDANLLRDYDKDRQDIITGIGRADRQEGINIAQKRFDAQQRYKEAQQKLEWQKYLAGLTQKEREAAERARHNKATEGLSGERNKIQKEKGDKSNNKPFMVAGVNGQDVPLNQTQFRDLFNEAISSTSFQDPNKRRFKRGGGSIEERKNLVHKYYKWKNSPENIERESLDDVRRAKGMPTSNEPVKNIISQPVSHSTSTQQSAKNTIKSDPLGLFQDNQPEENRNAPKVDYSKLDFSNIPIPKADTTKKTVQFNPDKAKKFKGVPQGGF